MTAEFRWTRGGGGRRLFIAIRLLYVEDSASLRESVARGLRKAGYAVDVAGDGEEGLHLANSGEYDVVILDVMLPGREGLEVLRGLRAAGIDSEVLLLTARVQVADRVAGLESGADDYLVRPFAFEELVARVRALSRRRYGSRSDLIQIGGLQIDTAAGRAVVNGNEVPLRRREFVLLEYLARRRGAVLIVGGLVTSTLLNLFVVPALNGRFGNVVRAPKETGDFQRGERAE